MNVMTYRGFVGSVEASLEDGCLYGRILGIKDLILYEGMTLKELETDFHMMADLYLEDVKELSVEKQAASA